MTLSPRFAVLIATLGSAMAMTLTLLHYARSHSAQIPGGFWALVLGAGFVGILAGAGGHLAMPAEKRCTTTAIALGILSAALAVGLLLADIVWSFGS